MNKTLAPSQKKKVIRSELNIEKWPIFATSTFKGKSREFSREIITEEGKILSKKVIIGKIADKEIGVLRTFEMKGFYALVKIWEDAGKIIDKNVNFSLHQIAEILRREWGRTTYRQIENMIDRLRFTPIKWIYSWKRKGDKEEYSLEDGFTILADKKIFEKKEAKQRVFSFNSFKFHDAILKNLVENHTKPVYLDTILNFQKEISVLLYRHIDLVMAGKDHYSRKTKELFRDLDLTEYSRPSKRKQLLDPVLKELEGAEMSTGRISQASLEKTADGKDWKVVFRKSKKNLEIKNEEKQKKADAAVILAIELFNKRYPEKRGMLKEEVAEILVKKYSFDKVTLHISRISNDKTVKNPVGLLRTSLEKEWDLKPTQDENQQKEKQDRDEKEKSDKARQQREREEFLKTKDEEERLNRIFFNLSAEEQESMKEEARGKIAEEHIENNQQKTNKFLLMDVMVMIKVREMLRGREKLNKSSKYV